MYFGKLRGFLTAVIDDYVLNLASVWFKETAEYKKLLSDSTRSALSSSIRWLWLVGACCSIFILAQRQMLKLEHSKTPINLFNASIDYTAGLFLGFLVVCALASRFDWPHRILATLHIKALAVGFFLLGCYWALMLTMIEGNGQILFGMSLFLMLIFSSLAGLYVSTLCLYSFVVPITLLPLVVKNLFFEPFQMLILMGVVMTLFLVETGRRMLKHWFIQAIRQEYTNQTYAAALDEIAHSDSLTHIPNRRQFDERINKLIALAPLANTPPTVILIDVDYFKKYNDHYGHLVGDECLINVATALTRAVRNASGDLVARYGGEEFVVVLSDVSLAVAQDVAARIQNEINRLAIPHAASDIADHVTISQGIAQWEKNESVESLLNRADKALYLSKKQGRNRFKLAEPNP
ncbi:membrane-associated sensor domain-containing protein [Dryocola sp. LX212]|jgi:diguanylate cyclase (GGDEF)-like protein